MPYKVSSSSFGRLGSGVCLPLLGQHLVACVQSTLQTSHPSTRSDLYVLKQDVNGGDVS